MDLLARIEVDGVCLGGIRLSGVLRPKQVASVGAQTKTRAWAFRLGSSCASGVSHARCKWLPATCSPYHTSIRARLATPVRSLLPVTSNILPTNFHEWNHKTHCLPESAAYLVVDFIDRSANCVAFIWVNQSFVHKAIVIAKVAQIRVAPKGRISVPRRRHSCPAQCRRPKVVAQWRCTAKVSIVNSLLEGQKGAQTRPSRRCIDSAHRRRSRATCAGFVVARSAPIPMALHK